MVSVHLQSALVWASGMQHNDSAIGTDDAAKQLWWLQATFSPASQYTNNTTASMHDAAFLRATSVGRMLLKVVGSLLYLGLIWRLRHGRMMQYIVTLI